MTQRKSEVAFQIKWSIFARYPEDKVTCVCGTDFYSHTVIRSIEFLGCKIVSKKPCPECSRQVGHAEVRLDEAWEDSDDYQASPEEYDFDDD